MQLVDDFALNYLMYCINNRLKSYKSTTKDK
jgi:hypothetical protein